MLSITIEKDLAVAMRDGAELATDVYRPAEGAPFPALLMRLPYDKERPAFRDGLFDVLLAVKRGYAVVVQDCRGTGASPARFDPFANEAADGADALAWVAEQQWSTGAVGMVGSSYHGITQWLAAAEAPAAVQAIAPVASSPDLHDRWVYQGGAFELGFNLFWFAFQVSPDQVLREVGAGTASPERLVDQLGAADALAALYRRLPLVDLPEIAETAPAYFDWLAHPEPDDYWRRVAPPVDFSRVEAPAFMVGGWYDIFLRGTLRGYQGMKEAGGSNGARRPRLVIGPWAHGNFSGSFPERDFGVMSSLAAADIVGAQLDWFDRHLKGIEAEQAPPVRIFVVGPDVWRDEEDWPLPDTRLTDYHLHSGGRANSAAGDGTLATEPATEEPPDSYRYDPKNPVPTVGGSVLLPGAFVSANAGPRDQAEVERRHDVLCFSGGPLVRDLEVTGPVELVLFASSSALDTDFTGKLVDVFPDGRAELVCDGILRARYRESLLTPAPLEPGEVYELRIDLGATSRVFFAGHRLRLEVSSSNFPRFDRNTNSGGTIATDGPGDLTIALNRVYHDRRHPSRLVLPVIERA